MLYHKAQEAKKNLQLHAQEHYNHEIMLPARLIDTLRYLLHDDDIITLDNGLYKVWFARNYPCYTPNTLLLDNALATMGAGYSSGIAAKLLHPDKKVVTVTGDG